MSYSIDSITADCYPGTTCLINKLGIRDDKQLAFVEAGITLMKDSELSEHPILGNYDFAHYKAIHQFLFEDLYDWAGTVRTVDISKKGTGFVRAKDINRSAESAFERLHEKNLFKDMPFDEFIENLSDFYGVINMIHPFREGNGRTQRVFFAQLIRNAGYEINFSEIDTDLLMIATIQAAGGVDDSLKTIFRESVHPSMDDRPRKAK